MFVVEVVEVLWYCVTSVHGKADRNLHPTTVEMEILLLRKGKGAWTLSSVAELEGRVPESGFHGTQLASNALFHPICPAPLSVPSFLP